MEHSEDRDEQKLVGLVRQRNSAAMRALYNRYVEGLTAVCSHYVVCDDDIKDVLQDSFLKIFTSIGTFEYRGPGSLRAWMNRIVVNESLKFLKRSGEMSRVICDGDLPDVADEEEPDVEAVPASAISEMICQLPAGYRTVFNLYVFEKKSHKEIAGLLNISESTSASQYHRAKSILARKINAYKSMSHEGKMGQ